MKTWRHIATGKVVEMQDHQVMTNYWELVPEKPKKVAKVEKPEVKEEEPQKDDSNYTSFRAMTQNADKCKEATVKGVAYTYNGKNWKKVAEDA